MFAGLIESKRAHELSAGGTVASVLAHSSVLTCSRSSRSTSRATTGHRPAVAERRLPAGAHAGRAGPSRSALRRLRAPPDSRPHRLAADRCSTSPMIDADHDRNSRSGAQRSRPGHRSDPRATARACLRDRRKSSRAHCQAIHVPSTPRCSAQARVTGSVSARFVVDTLGRVEQGSIAFEPGGDVLFESSVRRALFASRFIRRGRPPASACDPGASGVQLFASRRSGVRSRAEGAVALLLLVRHRLEPRDAHRHRRVGAKRFGHEAASRSFSAPAERIGDAQVRRPAS